VNITKLEWIGPSRRLGCKYEAKNFKYVCFEDCGLDSSGSE
jgi:hypothetical protein